MMYSKNVFFVVFTIIMFVALSSLSLNAQWKRQTNGLPADIGFGASIDACAHNTAVVSTGSELYRTSDAGEYWQKLQSPIEVGFIVDISMFDSSHIWICDAVGKIHATTDAGLNWTLQFYDTTRTKFMNYIEMFNLNNGIAMGDHITLGAGPALILTTSDGGKNWISVNDSAFGGYSGDTWRRINFVDINTGYFFESGINPGKMHKTADGGISWLQTSYPAFVQVLKFFSEKIGLAIPGTQKIYRTIDGGETWQLFSTPHQGWANDIEFAPDDPTKVWMTDFQKMWFSSDTGRTWHSQFNLGSLDIVFVDDQTGWFVRMDGVYHTNSGGEYTAVEEEVIQKPQTFDLMQNYPNPFNAATKISYVLVEPGVVKLSIFNLLGKEVATLVNERQQSGSHEVFWNADGFPSGTYFYRLEAGEFKATRKLVLLK
jgi:photosystem II stability/assembly factor-like uncharacterized protein